MVSFAVIVAMCFGTIWLFNYFCKNINNNDTNFTAQSGENHSNNNNKQTTHHERN